MNKPLEFYTKQKEIHQLELSKLSKKLMVSSLIRLLIFLAICFAIYYFFGNMNVIVPVIIGGIALFLFLVSRHSDLKDKSDKQKEIIKLNELEIDILKTRNFQDLPSGSEFEDPMHAYSQDIDLFGRGSFFQYSNRTALYEGTKKLVGIFTENSIENIQQKQETVKELAQKPEFRQEFTALARLVKTETPSKTVINWFKNYKNFVPNYIKWLPTVFSVFSLLVIAGYSFDYLKGIHLFLWFLAGLLFTGIYLKKINLLSGSVSKIQDTFHQYHFLLGLIERENFSSDTLKKNQQLINEEKKKASAIFKEFSKAIDSLDQRNNMLFGIFANGFLLWDLRQSYKLEKWISNYREHVENWFEVIEFTDAYNSLGNFVFNHPDYVFPEIINERRGISATKLAHPLLDPKKRIANDFAIGDEEFFIITGANMAGKSTFLRTVSLQIVMCNIGLPVCAETCKYSPIKLITSMRTSDSLSDDESYFFSELKRLKFIVEEIKTDRYFIILDEILKGTNSSDKAIGSKKFIRKLVNSNSTGIIATHDLSLCEITSELSQVKNHYFDAEIINDELHFDYKFKDGICQNMNASFLLRKMEIVDD
ncbi:DNA mismatch repair protein MutS [Salegentibacter salinarum]|uniref:DNA mismatch repair protein MutS n=1 Tax=Salegentibacter salinarum TaxID=447422 RepID=A0A2N0U283_9FLAO|nr:DNA mismatch repair protein MutS [Salegentibacter salinarum]PKD21107.1 DNA mismatch repair protein MutS [Salegentibacter salinarum]SKB76008.1 MutS domain V [Salegentibacter salinarum]